MKALLAILFLALTLSSGLSQAQKAPHFKKKQILIGSTRLEVELAETEAQHAYGLMNRKTLKDSEGMLFIFKDNKVRSFWMKNTFVPLSIGYFDNKKVLNQVLDMEPMASVMQTDLPTYNSDRPAMYALEVPKGWFQRNKIKLGSSLTVP